MCVELLIVYTQYVLKEGVGVIDSPISTLSFHAGCNVQNLSSLYVCMKGLPVGGGVCHGESWHLFHSHVCTNIHNKSVRCHNFIWIPSGYSKLYEGSPPPQIKWSDTKSECVCVCVA